VSPDAGLEIADISIGFWAGSPGAGVGSVAGWIITPSKGAVVVAFLPVARLSFLRSPLMPSRTISGFSKESKSPLVGAAEERIRWVWERENNVLLPHAGGDGRFFPWEEEMTVTEILPLCFLDFLFCAGVLFFADARVRECSNLAPTAYLTAPSGPGNQARFVMVRNSSSVNLWLLEEEEEEEEEEGLSPFRTADNVPTGESHSAYEMVSGSDSSNPFSRVGAAAVESCFWKSSSS